MFVVVCKLVVCKNLLITQVKNSNVIDRHDMIDIDMICNIYDTGPDMTWNMLVYFTPARTGQGI